MNKETTTPDTIPVEFRPASLPKDTSETVNILANHVHEMAISKGWWDKERNDAELLMLMVCELAEGCEGLRHGNPPSDHIPEFSAMEEELADTIVRILDMCEARGYRIGEALVAKIEFNANRPHRHGGKKF